MDILHFAIYPSINRRLSFFQVLAIIMNVDVQISLQYPAFNYFGDIPRSGISVTCGNSTFNFLRKLHTVIHMFVPFHVPTSFAQGFQYLRIPANTCYFLVLFVCFYCNYANGCAVIPQCGFDLHVPTI